MSGFQLGFTGIFKFSNVPLSDWRKMIHWFVLQILEIVCQIFYLSKETIKMFSGGVSVIILHRAKQDERHK